MDKEDIDIKLVTHYYSILGAPLSASKDELRRARNKLLHLFHPDRRPSGWIVDESEPEKRAYVIQGAYLYLIENYDEIRKELGFLSEVSLTNRMPLKTRSHWIYTTVAACDTKEQYPCDPQENGASSGDAQE